MIFASSDFGLSFALEWAAIPIVAWFVWRYPIQRGFGDSIPSLKKLMNDRRDTIREQLEAGERAKEEAERLVAERTRALEQAKAEAETILSQAKRNAERLVAEGHRRAEDEYQHALRRAEAAIEQSLTQVREEVLARVGAAVVQAASKVVAAELDTENHHRLIGEALAAAETETAGER